MFVFLTDSSCVTSEKSKNNREVIMPKNKKTFEENLIQLEEIISRLENGETNLDECIEIYEKGITLSKECMKMLDDAQQKVNMVTKQNTEADGE